MYHITTCFFGSSHVDRGAVELAQSTFDHGLSRLQILQQSLWLLMAASGLWLQCMRWM